MKNLIYYMYPVQGNMWKWHLDQLFEYLDAFDGARLIRVSEDEHSESLAAVVRYFGKRRAEFSLSRNDPNLRETVCFQDQLRMVYETSPKGFTFYAHTKGVSQPDHFLEKAKLWAQVMYFMNLKSQDLIDELMKRYSAIGTFRRQMLHGGSNWHFAGTFFWFKNEALFSNPRWNSIFMDRYGIEGYIGGKIPIEQSYDLSSDPFPDPWYSDWPPMSVFQKRLDFLVKNRASL